MGHIAPLHTLLRIRDLGGALSSQTRFTIVFQNESNGGCIVVSDVAGVVQ